MFQQRIIKIITASLFLAFFVFLTVLGLRQGKAEAQSRLFLQVSEQIQKALTNFYGDNERFPTAAEFAEVKIMSRYLSSMPAAAFLPSKACRENFLYARPSGKSYELMACLPAKTQGFPKGWHKFKKS